LVNFAQEIGVEIFEAKMLTTLQKLNQLLNAVLEKNISEELFMDSIAEETAKLFGAEGVVILWKQAQNTSHYQVTGRAGKIKHFFGIKQYVSSSHSIWNNPTDYISYTLKEDSKVEKLIGQLGYGSYMHIPMQIKTQSFNGYITLFDVKRKSQVTPSLREELKLLAIEVEQVMLRFFVNQEVMKGIRATIGHDISSILRSINGVCDHLDRINVTDNVHKRNLQKQIGDIRGYMHYGKNLLDFFFDRLNEKDTTKTFDNYKNIPAFAEMLKEEMSHDELLCIQSYNENVQSNENDIYNIILSVLQAKNIFAKLDFFGSSYPILDRKLRLIPSLWINKEVIRLIVNNLLDNFEKYHLQETKLKIDSNKTDTGWEILFENIGRPLTKEFAQNTYELFGYGVRFSSNVEGEGLGLFTSRTLILQFGGDLTLNYQKDISENKGIYTFRLFLPDWLERQANSTKDLNIWNVK
jgi:signal transduction histidine kinase